MNLPSPILLLLLLIASTTQNSSQMCPLGCTCYLDTRGRSVVECRRGGMIGPLVLTNISTAVEVLKIVAPEDNQNELSMNPIFQNFRNLEEIHIIRSNIPNLGEHFFYGLNKLEILNLAQNNITQPLPANFRGIPKLKELILDDNRIISLTSEAFRYLTELRLLSLQKNRIENIKAGVLRSLTKLRVLKLSGNSIGEFNPEVFSDIKELRTLECKACFLTKINTSVHRLIPQLTNLDLSDNSLTIINATDFADLTKLKLLKLDGNKLTVLNDHIFSKNEELKKLSLSHNQIYKIHLEAFSMLDKLEEMDLSFNKLEHFDESLLKPMAKSIQRLSFSGNRIPLVSIAASTEYTMIKDLQISDCGINEIPEGFAPNSINVLNLAANQLSYISASVLPTELKELDLSKNMFRGLDEHVVDIVVNLHRVKLEFNPWSCDLCHILPMLESVNRSAFLYNLRCALPFHHTNKLLGSLKKEQLNWCSAASYSSSDINFFLAKDDGRLGIMALLVSILLIVLTAAAVLGAFCYSRRHAARYYTHEEKRSEKGLADDRQSMCESHSPLFGGEELNFTFPADASATTKKKISVATIDEIGKEHGLMSNGT